ncbi:MAG TPA: carbamoyltransferase C-terminal domain-containing protein, partial [Candidatus Deferrimicrobium sp.]|nr:carbamoyltransferase C-terminal domain-containing protein [Candidatus Deferrimicrobium sp.]
ISGSLQLVHEDSDGDKHDAAAVLISDGKVVSAIEEERLNRIKHSDKFPIEAIRFVLRQAGIGLHDLDQICYYGLPNYFFEKGEPVPLAKKIQAVTRTAFGCEIDEKKLYFVHHHLAHAASTFYMSGFERSLVLSIDGQGDDISGMVLNGEGKKLEVLDKYSIPNSLGIYYLNVIYLLGYKQFDEYKVMGLAPYGNPGTYRDLFKSFYTLLPEGKYNIDLKKVKKLYLLAPRRQKDEPFNQVHKDIAAALQESVEEIALHILTYYQKKYNHTHLCLAGGVAHNCSMNGKILYSGLFNEVFVQPAAHDGGCALGAALYRYHELNPHEKFSTLDHLYWGTPTGDNDAILKTLTGWDEFLQYEKVDHITRKAAQLMAEGAVIGWMQGQSEFGPRALGNRTIAADPRPPENKDIINEMVKKREAYRPFAPSVMEEYVHEYFDLPTKNSRYPYMIFVVKVKPDKQKLLGAITHFDGTARIQTVSKETNPTYWQLIEEFRQITGVPIILNTSFNNNAEPIVDSVDDAIVCFYTTKLNYLVIGDYLIKKKEAPTQAYLKLIPSLPKHNILSQTNKFISLDEPAKIYEIKNNITDGYRSKLSAHVFHILNQADGKTTLGDLMEKTAVTGDETKKKILAEIIDLWGKRFIALNPAGIPG